MNNKKRKCLRHIVFFVLFFYLFVGIFYFLSRFERTIDVKSQVYAEKTSTGEENINRNPEFVSTFYFDDECYGTNDDIESYLFIGTDESAQKPNKKSMADYLLLLIFNRTKKEYGFLQIDRNTMTDVAVLEEDQYLNDEDVTYLFEQVCTAYWYGSRREIGCENVVDAVSGILGELQIDGYYAFGMDDISKMNAFVGGVEVTIQDDFSHFDIEMIPGKRILLNDEQAYLFLHSRMDVADGTNENRLARQEEYFNGFIEKLRKKFQDEYMENPKQFVLNMNEYLSTFSVKPQSNRSLSEWLYLAKELNEATNLGMFHFEGETKVGQTLGDGLFHEECYVSEEEKADILSNLLDLKKIE